MLKKFLSTIVALMISFNAYAWSPQKPINIYIGAGPGTTVENMFRKLAAVVTEKTGATFVYHYKPGPGQVALTNSFLEMPRDGYHLLIPFFGDVFILSEIMYKDQVKWNMDSFDYVIGLPSDPVAVIAPIDSNVNNPEDFFKDLRNPKNQVNFGTSPGTFTVAYHSIVHYGKADKANVKQINYKAAREVLVDVASKNLTYGVIPAGLINTARNTGRVKIIGITSNVKLKGDSSIPLLTSSVKELSFYSYRSVVLPKDTHPEIVKWFNENFRAALNNSEIIKSIEDNFETINPETFTPNGLKNTLIEARKIYQPVAERSIQN